MKKGQTSFYRESKNCGDLGDLMKYVFLKRDKGKLKPQTIWGEYELAVETVCNN